MKKKIKKKKKEKKYFELTGAELAFKRVMNLAKDIQPMNRVLADDIRLVLDAAVKHFNTETLPDRGKRCYWDANLETDICPKHGVELGRCPADSGQGKALHILQHYWNREHGPKEGR